MHVGNRLSLLKVGSPAPPWISEGTLKDFLQLQREERDCQTHSDLTHFVVPLCSVPLHRGDHTSHTWQQLLYLLQESQ